MKRNIIFCVCLLYYVSLYSQNVEPTQIPFNFNNSSSYYLSGDSTYFQQDKFLIGWQWGGTPLFPRSNAPALELEKNIKMKIIY